MINQFVLQRLAFIRYGFLISVDQSRQPEPMSAHSILGFHDTVELFLQLVSEHLNVAKKRIEFIEYWSLIDPEIAPERLGQKAGMSRLNNARVSLKHHGNLPSGPQIEEFRALTTAFFEENTSMVFGLRFDEISMADLVHNEPARTSLKEAEELLANGNTSGSMRSIAVAFEQLIDGINEGYFKRYYRSPFHFGDDFTFDSAFFRSSADPSMSSERARFEDKMVKAVESMQSAVRVMSLGIDYRKYAQFSLMTPVAQRMMDGQYTTQLVQGMAGSIDWPPSAEACRFCIDFVVDSAVRMRATDITTLPEGGKTGPGPIS